MYKAGPRMHHFLGPDEFPLSHSIYEMCIVYEKCDFYLVCCTLWWLMISYLCRKSCQADFFHISTSWLLLEAQNCVQGTGLWEFSGLLYFLNTVLVKNISTYLILMSGTRWQSILPVCSLVYSVSKVLDSCYVVHSHLLVASCLGDFTL